MCAYVNSRSNFLSDRLRDFYMYTIFIVYSPVQILVLAFFMTHAILFENLHIEPIPNSS